MYTIQYFIDKFSAIPEELWCSDIQQNDRGQRCAYGHCRPVEELEMGAGNDGEYTGEMRGLGSMSIEYFGNSMHMAHINNGTHPRFQQPTEKQRVLAALQWCKEQEAQKIIDKALSQEESILEVERRPKESALS